jgi:phosphate transport system protein
MSKHLQSDLERLKKHVLEIGTIVEENLAASIHALSTRNRAQAKAVVEADYEIDHREVLIEEECLKILALHQPVAKDLRFVIAILKLNNDLERVGDLAVNIAQRAIELAGLEPIDIPQEINEMAQKTTIMVKKSFDALIESDPELAVIVCASDDEVDALHRRLFTTIQNQIRQDPAHLEQHIQMLSVTRYLERIADQATNIAEDVIYMVNGDVVRHKRD